jgi:uncharacterized cupin superfamily protein
MSRKIELSKAPVVDGTLYPPPYDVPCRKRSRTRLGDAAGLTQLGVNLCRLPPGAWSSQRHWHSHEDELVYVLAGEVVLVTDDGEETLRAGDSAGFRGGDPNGHHLQNRSAADALILEIGSRMPASDSARYPGIDLRTTPGKPGYQHADGTPYPPSPRAT